MKKRFYIQIFMICLCCFGSCFAAEAYDPIKRDFENVRSVVPYEFLPEQICWSLFRSAHFKEISYKKEEEVSGIIFVGDSRVVGMSFVGGYKYIGKNGEGYHWFVDDGCYAMFDYIEWYPDHEVVLCFGVNDLPNISEYIEYYQYLMDSMPDTRFWVMSVNPCKDAMAEASGYAMRNYMIEPFNALLKEAFPDVYIDTYHYLVKNGFGSPDGIHYDEGTYLVIQEYTKSWIESKINE